MTPKGHHYKGTTRQCARQLTRVVKVRQNLRNNLDLRFTFLEDSISFVVTALPESDFLNTTRLTSV